MTFTSDVAAMFAAEPGYMDTASLGMPPNAAWEAMRDDMARWRTGRARPPEYDAHVAASRESFARIVGADPADVSVGSQVSALVGLVAASLPDGARVVAAEGDFTSVLFPFLAHADRGVTTTLVPVERLADAIVVGTDLVATSAVQSADGTVADLDAITEAARRVGARTLIDGTQACGWLPLDATRFDHLVCGAYKWLLAPRGSAFMVTTPAAREHIRPLFAGWYAGDDVWTSIYGAPLRLARDGRRLDQSPSWLAWVGTAPALALIERIGVQAIHAHDVALANRLRAGLGMPPGDSAIVSVRVHGAAERLEAAGIRASTRAGAARLSVHLYTTTEDVDRAIEVLTG